MANTVLKYTGTNIGKSIYELNCENLIKEILEKSKENNCKINCPTDVVVSKNLHGIGKNKEIREIENDEIILDIGPKTILSIKKIINNSNTVLWNGPAGYFENSNFANGTKEIIKIISEKKLLKTIFFPLRVEVKR